MSVERRKSGPPIETPVVLRPVLISGGVTALAEVINDHTEYGHNARGPIAVAARKIVNMLTDEIDIIDEQFHLSVKQAAEHAQHIMDLVVIDVDLMTPWEPIREEILNRTSAIKIRTAGWY